MKIARTNDFQIKTNIGCTITLQDIYHVLDFWLSLLSTIAFDKESYNNHFSNNI